MARAEVVQKGREMTGHRKLVLLHVASLGSVGRALSILRSNPLGV